MLSATLQSPVEFVTRRAWPVEVPLHTLWLSDTLPRRYFQSTVVCSRISFLWLTASPICGIIKLCALKAGRRCTVGANWEPARMMAAWDSCSAPGLHSPGVPLFKRVWEWSSNARIDLGGLQKADAGCQHRQEGSCLFSTYYVADLMLDSLHASF